MFIHSESDEINMMQIPTSLVSGDTWSWTDSLADYPAPTWQLVYHLRGPQPITLTSSDDGSDHLFSAAAATTGGYKPGTYEWSARVDDGTTFITVDTGRVTVKPNFANAAQEYRSFWRQVLDELEPVILGRAKTDQLSMSIAGRSLQRMSWDELLKVYDRAKLQVASEDGGATRYVVGTVRP
jgi:hypothetical protein